VGRCGFGLGFTRTQRGFGGASPLGFSQRCRMFRRSVNGARCGWSGNRVVIVEERGLAGRRRLTNDLVAIAEWKLGGPHPHSGRYDIIEQTSGARRRRNRPSYTFAGAPRLELVRSETNIGWHVVELRRSRRGLDALRPHRDAQRAIPSRRCNIRRDDIVEQAHG
jgi:hypothetical protein